MRYKVSDKALRIMLQAAVKINYYDDAISAPSFKNSLSHAVHSFCHRPQVKAQRFLKAKGVPNRQHKLLSYIPPPQVSIARIIIRASCRTKERREEWRIYFNYFSFNI